MKIEKSKEKDNKMWEICFNKAEDHPERIDLATYKHSSPLHESLLKRR